MKKISTYHISQGPNLIDKDIKRKLLLAGMNDKTMQSALNGNCSKAFTLLIIKAVFKFKQSTDSNDN